MSANCFEEDLKWSESCHSADWWDPYYRVAFPTMVSVEKVPGTSAAQRAGIDKFVVLRSGKKVAVDEKIRRNRTPSDIALEIEHVPVDGSPRWAGWIEKPNQYTDYLAMGFQAYRVAFFLPFIPLQAAWIKNSKSWVSRFGIIKAANPTVNPKYHTHSVCVPTELLLGNLLAAMRVQL